MHPTPYFFAATEAPSLSLFYIVAGILMLFFCVAVVVRLGAIARETKKQTDHLEYIVWSIRHTKATEKGRHGDVVE